MNFPAPSFKNATAAPLSFGAPPTSAGTPSFNFPTNPNPSKFGTTGFQPTSNFSGSSLALVPQQQQQQQQQQQLQQQLLRYEEYAGQSRFLGHKTSYAPTVKPEGAPN